MPEETIPSVVLGNNTKIPILGLASWGWSVSFCFVFGYFMGINVNSEKIVIVIMTSENESFLINRKAPRNRLLNPLKMLLILVIAFSIRHPVRTKKMLVKPFMLK